MPRFTVTLQRRLRDNYNRPAPNPFLAPLPHPDKKYEMSIRTWEFDAKDEAECKRLLDEAYAAGIPGVQGYTLRSIAAMPIACACFGLVCALETAPARGLGDGGGTYCRKARGDPPFGGLE